MVEELHPTEIPLAFWVLFFLFSSSSSFLNVEAFADSAEAVRHRGVVPRPARPSPPQAPVPEHARSFLTGLGQVKSQGGVGGGGQLLKAIILLFLFLILTIVHISKKVSLKTETNPEMYIWDHAKATEETKPQVSCFKLVTPTPWETENRSGGSVYRRVYSVIFTETLLACIRNHCVQIGQVLL